MSLKRKFTWLRWFGSSDKARLYNQLFRRKEKLKKELDELQNELDEIKKSEGM